MYLEALTSNTKKIWPALSAFSDFCLAGGTALALQIGHRVSVDFDFFSEKELPPSLLDRLEDTFKNSEVKIILNSAGQLTILIDGVSVTFLTYRFPIFHPPVDFEGVKILSVLEIAATKAYVLGRRATYKDYVDLYFVMSEGRSSLKEIADLSQKKYGEEFNLRLFLEQLVYLDDIPETPIEFLRKSVAKKDIEIFFRKEAKKYFDLQ